MSDKEFGGNDDLSLPKVTRDKMDDLLESKVQRANTLTKATVQKIINEVLAANPSGGGGESQGANMTFAKEARDLLIECCVEFITMLSSEANDIAEKDAKKTIACEHITKALQELGFGDYVSELLKVADSFKTSQVTREKKQSKIEQSGMTNDELIRAQEELFRSAGEKYNAVSPGES